MTQSIAPIVNALGWTLLHSVWQGAIIGLLFLLSRYVLTSASPAIRHTNALAWLVLFVSLPVFTFLGLLLAATGTGVMSMVPSMLPVMHIARWPGESASLLPGALSVLGCMWLSGVMVLSTRLLGEWRRLERHTDFGSRPLPQLDLPFAALRTAMNVQIKARLVETANSTIPVISDWSRLRRNAGYKPVEIPGATYAGCLPDLSVIYR